ncbi:MAG: hypothetical protein GXW99_11790 [Clostridiales bacterium]|nr:hypothetical protein [Clostridiales bacterium]
MKQNPKQIGIICVLLVTVTVCLGALAVLSLTTADADKRLAERSLEVTQRTYSREQAAQVWLAQADAQLKNGTALTDLPDTRTQDGVTVKVIAWQEESLAIGLTDDGADGYRIIFWKPVTDWEPDTDIGTLWAG